MRLALPPLLGLCLVLAACGGGGGGTATPPAPPPATPDNTTVSNLQFDEAFESAMATLSFNISGGSGAPVSTATTSENFGEGAEIFYDASDDSFTVTYANGGVTYQQTFDDSQIASAAGASFIQYVNGTDEFLLINPDTAVFVDGADTRSLDYASFGAWASESAATQDVTLGYWAFGVETTPTDMPTTGTATHQGLVIGALTTNAAAFDITGAIVLETDFAAGTVNAQSLLLQQNALTGGAVTVWQQMESSATIAAGTNGFTGATTATGDASYSGTLNGSFFGPDAIEAAGTWTLGNTTESAVGSFGTVQTSP